MTFVSPKVSDADRHKSPERKAKEVVEKAKEVAFFLRHWDNPNMADPADRVSCLCCAVDEVRTALFILMAKLADDGMIDPEAFGSKELSPAIEQGLAGEDQLVPAICDTCGKQTRIHEDETERECYQCSGGTVRRFQPPRPVHV